MTANLFSYLDVPEKRLAEFEKRARRYTNDPQLIRGIVLMSTLAYLAGAEDTYTSKNNT